MYSIGGMICTFFPTQYNNDTLEYGQIFAKSIVRSALVSHRKALAFEKAWPELIHQLVKEIVVIDPN